MGEYYNTTGGRHMFEGHLLGAAVILGTAGVVLAESVLQAGLRMARAVRTYKAEKTILIPTDKDKISAAIGRALEGGATTPEIFARSLAAQGIYTIYNREDENGKRNVGPVVGVKFGIQGIKDRYTGGSLGWPWARIKDRLHYNDGNPPSPTA